MSETAVTKRKSNADYETILAQLLVEMNWLEEQMDRDHAKSELLRGETQVIKAEPEIIKAKTAMTLSQLTQQLNHLTRVI